MCNIFADTLAVARDERTEVTNTKIVRMEMDSCARLYRSDKKIRLSRIKSSS